MPTLRERPSRGDISPAKKSSGNSSQFSPSTSKSTRSSFRESVPKDAIEVRETIEAKGDQQEDVDMEDADAPTRATVKGGPDADTEMVDAGTASIDAKPEVDADGDVDADGEPDADADANGEPDEQAQDDQDQEESDEEKDMLQLIRETSEYLCGYTIKVDGEDHEIASGFQRLVNKRSLPDYFEVIKEPMAFSTIRGKLNKRTYTSFKEFVHDVTRICHNAQVYNRPSAPIFSDAGRLLEVFKEKLAELVKDGDITAEEAVLPDLGPLPEFEDSPPPEDEEEEEQDDEDEEEDEEEEDDDSDDEGRRRRAKRGGRRARRGADNDDDPHKKRGRPPKVLTPLEARTQSLLKGLRRFKSDDGQLRISSFERLPDKADMPDYYASIRNPIALDTIKKKHKRKKYTTIDQVLQDLELMFGNAMQFNEEGSQVYEDAAELLKQARLLTAEEKAKPDDEFRDEDGKLPLSSIEHKGEIWRVGDWVHIRNANDLQKPIVAQLYRLWSDASGQKWVNACWYYRPEQTVHRFDKHFYENEVVKTGQYRDHPIEDVEDRCFVMFITRYPRGRPRGLPRDKAVYLCEARYNEEKFKFNKIKTWTSCLPDEVRDRDYEMDLFEQPRVLRKVPSPIKHLLQADAKESDDLPKPTWRSMNAPPLIGAVHRRPREPNESPPPAPNPLLHTAVAPVPLAIGPPRVAMKVEHGHGVAGAPPYHHPAAVAPAPIHSPAAHYRMQHFVPQQPPPSVPSPHPAPLHLQPQPQQQQQQPMPMHVPPHPAMGQQMQPSPHYPPHGYPQQYGPQQPQAPPPQPLHYQQHPPPIAPAFEQHQHHPQHHRQVHPAPPVMTPSRTPMAPAPSIAPLPHANAPPANVYNPPRAPEAYTLAEHADAAIPKEVREQFQRDENGRVLFFTAPPLKRANNGVSQEYAHLGHSVEHLANIKQIRAERARKRKERDEALAREQEANKKRSPSQEASAQKLIEQEQTARAQLMEKVILDWCAELNKGTEALEKDLGEGWKEMMQQSREENKGLTDEEIQQKNLRWFYEDLEKKGKITSEKRKEMESMFLAKKNLKA